MPIATVAMIRVRRREGIVVGASVVNMGSFYHAQIATTQDEEALDLEDERSFRPGGDGGGPILTLHTD